MGDGSGKRYIGGMKFKKIFSITVIVSLELSMIGGGLGWIIFDSDMLLRCFVVASVVLITDALKKISK